MMLHKRENTQKRVFSLLYSDNLFLQGNIGGGNLYISTLYSNSGVEL